MYEANKGQIYMGEDGATGGAETAAEQDKKNEKAKGKGAKTPTNKESKKDSNKSAAKQKDALKTRDKKEGKGNNKKDKEGATTEADDELGPTLEKQYLELFAQEEDIFGPPKQFKLKEDQA